MVQQEYQHDDDYDLRQEITRRAVELIDTGCAATPELALRVALVEQRVETCPPQFITMSALHVTAVLHARAGKSRWRWEHEAATRLTRADPSVLNPLRRFCEGA